MATGGSNTRLVFALDYGTTFTGFAHGSVKEGELLDFSQIRSVKIWPPNYSGEKVPSEISYELATDAARQWGADISPGSLIVAFTKLELDPQDRLEELKAILSALEGMANLDFDELRKSPGGIPKYPARSATEIAGDFLSKVRRHVIEELDREPSRNAAVRRNVPIDLVVTIPAVWSSAAKNRTFQAVNQAGFNQSWFPTLRQISFVSEPEAAALYTLTSVYRSRRLIIMEGDSFILCDAGGGTVDVIAYRITSVAPEFKMEQIGYAGSGRCGASFIDQNFRKWLQEKLGPTTYAKLAQKSPEQDLSAHKVMGPHLRRVMTEFEPIKRAFGSVSETRENFIELPDLDIDDDPQNDIMNGEIRLQSETLRQIFRPCVEGVLDLIATQISQIERAKTRSIARCIFMSGGFANSDHLLGEVRTFAKHRRIEVHKGDNPQAAVLYGAVATGMGFGNKENNVSAFASPRHFGIVLSHTFAPWEHSENDIYADQWDGTARAEAQMTWLIRKGDAVFSDKPLENSIEIGRKFGTKDERNFKATLVSCDENEAPETFQKVPSHTSQTRQMLLDLTGFETKLFDKAKSKLTGKSYFCAKLKLSVRIADQARFEMSFAGKEVAVECLDLYPDKPGFFQGI